MCAVLWCPGIGYTVISKKILIQACRLFYDLESTANGLPGLIQKVYHQKNYTHTHTSAVGALEEL